MKLKEKQQRQLPTETADGQKAAMPMRSGKRSREVSLEEMEASLEEMKVKIFTMVEEFQQLQRQFEKYKGQDAKKRRCNEDMEASTLRWLQLKFTSQPSPKIFTMTSVKAKKSDALRLILVNPQQQIVSSGPESSMEVELVLVNGEFPSSETGNWTLEDFEDIIVPARKGKPPLLIGDVLRLNEGVAVVGNIKITDNSSWLPSKSFRLAARVPNGYFNQMRIKEAITNPFVVNEDRLKSFQKHYPPCLKDHVWRLKGIAKNGKYHQRLIERGIFKVEDFLKSLEENGNGLRDEILKMPPSVWEDTVNHAETCIRSGNMAPFCNQQIKPGWEISQATEVVKQLSIQTVYEQHEGVVVSSNVPIRVQNHGWSNSQQFGQSSHLQHDITSEPFAESSRTVVAGTSTSGDTWKHFGLVAPINPGAKSPADGMSSFLNDIPDNDDYAFGSYEITNQDSNLDDDTRSLQKILELDHFDFADYCFNMPAESVKHEGNLTWSTLIAALAFSVRIVAVKDMNVTVD